VSLSVFSSTGFQMSTIVLTEHLLEAEVFSYSHWICTGHILAPIKHDRPSRLYWLWQPVGLR
jgi:hypothetical protein